MIRRDLTSNVLGAKELKELVNNVSNLYSRLKSQKWSAYVSWKEIGLLNSAIEMFRAEVERKTGSPAKPTTTGFRKYALNRVKIETDAKEVIKSFDTECPVFRDYIGSLGADKGNLELCTEFRFQNGNVTDGSLSKLKDIKKSSSKEFARTIRRIKEQACSQTLFTCITELNAIEDIERIETVYELLLFKKFFSLNGQPYSPSSGEASMVMLQKELETEKEIYILDEPERSLGNEYINDIIVLLINRLLKYTVPAFPTLTG